VAGIAIVARRGTFLSKFIELLSVQNVALFGGSAPASGIGLIQ
jgi:hypothetical protein